MDKYHHIKCGTCGEPWVSHPDDTTCAQYRPKPERILFDEATAATIRANGLDSVPPVNPLPAHINGHAKKEVKAPRKRSKKPS